MRIHFLFKQHIFITFMHILLVIACTQLFQFLMALRFLFLIGVSVMYLTYKTRAESFLLDYVVMKMEWGEEVAPR